MKTVIKAIKSLDGTKTYSLSKEDVSLVKSNDLISSIIKSLEQSYSNNVNDLPVDYGYTIKLLYDKLIKLQKYSLDDISNLERFKLAEAANDLAMAFVKSFEIKGNKKDLERAETFYLFSFTICPLTIAYFNYFSLLREYRDLAKIKTLYKDMLDAQNLKVSKSEIKEIFFKS